MFIGALSDAISTLIAALPTGNLMHVVVLGAGVVGVTTAYYLSKAGHRVTVIDRAANVASETSFANGGQLSYGFAEALATPAFVRKIPALLTGRNFATRIRVGTTLLPWGARFLLQCTASRARDNTIALLELARQSSILMYELRRYVDPGDAYRPAGKLVLLSTDDEVRGAETATAAKRARGIDVAMLSRDEAEAIEPAIGTFTGPVKAAAFAKNDGVADAQRFSAGLREHMERDRAVTFRMRTPVAGLVQRNGAVSGARTGATDDDVIAGDAVVVCLGAWSDALLRPLGIRTCIYPVRGYSVTLPAGRSAPSASLTSLTNRFVFSRLNGDMRIAGFTDFDGFNQSNDDRRIDTLLAAARRLAPEFADYDAADQHRWGGFRPMTPSGLPVVGRTKIDGLFVNTGHGMLGWTLATATAKSVADAVGA